MRHQRYGERLEDIRVANNMSEIIGAVLAVAIVRSFPQYESVIAQIHS